MMKTREFTNEKDAKNFFYGIEKMTKEIYKSYDVATGKYTVAWTWNKKYFENK